MILRAIGTETQVLVLKREKTTALVSFHRVLLDHKDFFMYIYGYTLHQKKGAAVLIVYFFLIFNSIQFQIPSIRRKSSSTIMSLSPSSSSCWWSPPPLISTSSDISFSTLTTIVPSSSYSRRRFFSFPSSPLLPLFLEKVKSCK